MRGSIRKLRLAHVTALTVPLAVLVLAIPAHAVASAHRPPGPAATGAQPSPPPNPGIPINLQIPGLPVQLTVPVNLSMLGGRSSSPAQTSSAPATTAPPTANSPSHRPDPPTTPQTSHATHDRSTPPAQPGPSLVVARPAAPQQTRGHRHPSHPTHSEKPARHGGIAAVLFPTGPLQGTSPWLLLVVIAVFCAGVAGIVVVGGRRGRSTSKHRR